MGAGHPAEEAHGQGLQHSRGGRRASRKGARGTRDQHGRNVKRSVDGDAIYDLACEWVRENTELWHSWLPPCADDDAQVIRLASGVGYTISGCVAVESFCEHAVYGSTVQAT